MFVIVQDNSVILGPNAWNKRKFETVLQEDLELVVNNLPSSPPSTPITISNTVKIYPVQFDTSLQINPKIEIAHGPFWQFTDDVAIASYQALPKSIECVKGEMLGKLANDRWIKETEGTSVTIQGKLIGVTTQRGERDIFLQAVQLGKDGVLWKLDQVENVTANVPNPTDPMQTIQQTQLVTVNTLWLTLSVAELTSIVNAIVTKVQSAFDWEGDLASQINAATTLQELNSISW